jgi:K+-transporting ATPase ATPase A chain
MLVPSLIYFVLLSATAPLLGKYIAFVYAENKSIMSGYLRSQTAQKYFISLFCFNLVGIVITFAIIYWQKYLPFGENVESLNLAASINAAISFATSTFWQSHNPETQLSILSQIFGLTLQNFLSAATGMTVFIAFVRGVKNDNKLYVGNFYADFLRSVIYILLPLSTIVAFILISQGVPHDFIGHLAYEDLSGQIQDMFVGPIAGQTAIKTLASNGGSLLASASAHPFEAPSRFVVMFQLWLVLLMPAALIFAYGYLTDESKLSWSLYLVVIVTLFITGLVMYWAETKYNIAHLFPNAHFADNFNSTGKELIYDKFPSLSWILAIVTSSSGSQNLCMDNLSPLSMLILFFDLVVGKFMLEGVGSGFFTMLTYLMIAVFIKGLITGHRQNFCGKKISAKDINYVMIMLLLMPIGVLIFSGITFMMPLGKEITLHPQAQIITDVTYNFASAFAGNGSVLTGVNISSDYFNYMSALAMFIGRYVTIYYSLALTGSFSTKSKVVTNEDDELLGGEISIFLAILVLMIGALTFLPVLMLGPIVEMMRM